MRKVTLFIAMSLDGYIADIKGSTDWLSGQNAGEDDMMSYQEFIKDIDTVIMGWKTYDQVAHELSPDKWYYSDLDSYVMTHRKQASTHNIHFVDQDVCELVRELKQAQGKGIWICGGANIIHQLLLKQEIDRFHISIIPTILGKGISLFQQLEMQTPLKLISTKSYNGITDVIYEYR